MNWSVTPYTRNVHSITFRTNDVKLAVLSDLHWDNPKCDRKILKEHLDYCLENEIPVFINGDFFCLMQGRADRRSNKSDILPEHNNARYIDSVIEDAVNWFSPYASILTVIGYGNHETAIIKWSETDPLQRFVDLFNYKNSSNLYTGGYGGWFVIRTDVHGRQTTSKMKYFHGSGGGGIVTKGAINLTRASEMYEDYDIFAMGHIHENAARNDVKEKLKTSNKGYEVHHHNIHSMITGAYKEEYADGSKGWHIERGAPPKPIGGRILNIKVRQKTSDRKTTQTKTISSTEFIL